MSVFKVGSNKSSQNNFPSVRPTLDLDFANSKTLDPRITFTRASGGSYVGADGLIKLAGVNEPRFDHDPVTGESLGLLVEEARTNLNLNSAGTYNGLTNITSNSFLAPDGTFTAATFQPPVNSNSGGTHELYAVYPSVGTISVGNTVTVYARRNSGSAMKYLVLRLLTSSYFNFYNLETGVVTVNDGSMPGSMTDVGNGWWRCQLTNNISGGSTPLLRTFVSTVLSIAPQTNGDPIYLWGVQNEAGSFPTSYIPTEGSTRTRAEDTASITGKNFSSWYRQDEGTFLGKGRQTYTTTNQFEALIVVGGYPNRSWGWAIIGSINLWSVGTDSLDAGSFYTGLTPNVPFSFNVAQAQKSNQSVAVADGVIKASVTPGQILYTNASQLSIGSNYDGHIARLTYYPVRLPDAQLQVLTR